MKRVLVLCVFLVLTISLGLFLLSYSFDTVVVPAFSTKISDEQGTPISNARVIYAWQHFSIEDEGHSEEVNANSDGIVSFPVRTIRATVADRIWGPIRQAKIYGVHAAYGPHAHLIVLSQDYEQAAIAIDSHNAPPHMIVLRAAKQ